MVSLPRSQVEMTDTDRDWQDRITKVVNGWPRTSSLTMSRRSARWSAAASSKTWETSGPASGWPRLMQTGASSGRPGFPPSGPPWTPHQRRPGQGVPPEKVRGVLPLPSGDPIGLPEKWSALPQFQKTRGALSMLAQWISTASVQQFRGARNEPLITLGRLRWTSQLPGDGAGPAGGAEAPDRD